MNCFFLVSLRSCALYEPLVLTYISICPVLPRKLQMFSKISIFWRRSLVWAAYFYVFAFVRSSVPSRKRVQKYSRFPSCASV